MELTTTSPFLCATICVLNYNFSSFKVHLKKKVLPLSSFTSAIQSDCVRCPIGSRPPSDRVPSAVRSVPVRRPIRFRPPSDQIPFGAR
nr:MAG TPA: hypothetical protein [Caudoviricetes sp.]